MGAEGAIVSSTGVATSTGVTGPLGQPPKVVETPPPPPPPPDPTINTADANNTTALAGTTTAPKAVTFANQTLPPQEQAQVDASVKLLPGVPPALVEAAVRKLAGSDPTDVKELMQALATIKPETAAKFLEGVGHGEPQGAKAFMSFLAQTGLEGAKLEAFVDKLGTLKNDTELQGLLRQTLEENKSWFSFIPGIGGLFRVSDTELEAMTKSAKSVSADIGAQQRIREQLNGVDGVLDKTEAQLKEMQALSPNFNLAAYQKELAELREQVSATKADPSQANVSKLEKELDDLEKGLDDAWFDAEFSGDGKAMQAKIEDLEKLLYDLDDNVFDHLAADVTRRDEVMRSAETTRAIAGPLDATMANVDALDSTLKALKTAGPEQKKALQERVGTLTAELAKQGVTVVTQPENAAQPTSWGFTYRDLANPEAPTIGANRPEGLKVETLRNLITTKKLEGLEGQADKDWAGKRKAIDDEVRAIDESIAKAKNAPLTGADAQKRDLLVTKLEQDRGELLKTREAIGARCDEIDGNRDAVDGPALLLMGKRRLKDPATGLSAIVDLPAPKTPQEAQEREQAVANALKQLQAAGVTATKDGDKYQFTCTPEAATRLGVRGGEPLKQWDFVTGVNQSASNKKLELLQTSADMGANVQRYSAAVAGHSDAMRELQAATQVLARTPNDPEASAKVSSLMLDYGLVSTGSAVADMKLLGEKIGGRLDSDRNKLTELNKQLQAAPAWDVKNAVVLEGDMREINNDKAELKLLVERSKRTATDSSFVTQLQHQQTPRTEAQKNEYGRLKTEYAPEMTAEAQLPDAPKDEESLLLRAMARRQRTDTGKGIELEGKITAQLDRIADPELREQTSQEVQEMGSFLRSSYMVVGQNAGFSRAQLASDMAAMEAGTCDMSQPLIPDGQGQVSQGGAAPAAQGEATPTDSTSSAASPNAPKSVAEVAHEAVFRAFSRAISAAFGLSKASQSEEDQHFTEKSHELRLDRRSVQLWVNEQKALARAKTLERELDQLIDDRADRRMRASGLRQEHLVDRAHREAVGNK